MAYQQIYWSMVQQEGWEVSRDLVMKTGAVFIDAVQVGQRHRRLDPKRCDLLAQSLKENGLQQPISVWSPDLDTIHLVAGLHRLEAAKKLGWDEIDCVYVQMDEIEREMWEIAENLHRVDLSKEERNRHIRRYAELLKEKEKTAKTKQNASFSKGGAPGPGRGHKSVEREIANQTGLSKDTVRRALSPQPATDPTKKANGSDQERVYQNLCRWWREANKGTRQRFIEAWIE